MSWDKSLPLEPVFALDTLRNRVNTILKSNQNRNNTQEGGLPNMGLTSVVLLGGHGGDFRGPHEHDAGAALLGSSDHCPQIEEQNQAAVSA